MGHLRRKFWRLVNMLPTLSALARKHVPCSRSCIRCGAYEDSAHVFLHCRQARLMWRNSTLGDFIYNKLAANMGTFVTHSWSLLTREEQGVVITICFLIWKVRNAPIYGGAAILLHQILEAVGV